MLILLFDSIEAETDSEHVKFMNVYVQIRERPFVIPSRNVFFYCNYAK
jgi:hypothetical protein